MKKKDGVTVWGYARVSTPTQKLDRQIKNIRAYYPEAEILEEYYSGRKIAGREEFQSLLDIVKYGDTIIFDSVSRMSRNADEGFDLYMKLFNSGVNLVFLNEHYCDTDVLKKTREATFQDIKTSDEDIDELICDITKWLNKYMKKQAESNIRLAFEQAQKEVDDLRTRTIQGMEASGAGEKISEAKTGMTYTTKKSEEVKEIILKKSKAFGGHLNDDELLSYLKDHTEKGCSRNSFYKYKRELSEGFSNIEKQAF